MLQVWTCYIMTLLHYHIRSLTVQNDVRRFFNVYAIFFNVYVVFFSKNDVYVVFGEKRHIYWKKRRIRRKNDVRRFALLDLYYNFVTLSHIITQLYYHTQTLWSTVTELHWGTVKLSICKSKICIVVSQNYTVALLQNWTVTLLQCTIAQSNIILRQHSH